MKFKRGLPTVVLRSNENPATLSIPPWTVRSLSAGPGPVEWWFLCNRRTRRLKPPPESSSLTAVGFSCTSCRRLVQIFPSYTLPSTPFFNSGIAGTVASSSSVTCKVLSKLMMCFPHGLGTLDHDINTCECIIGPIRY